MPYVMDAGPNAALGDYVLALIRSEQWQHRRVETISFRDASTLERHITLDISMLDIERVTSLDESCLTEPEFRPVPLMMLNKSLLIDFDLRDANGGSRCVARSVEDSFLAWSALVSLCAQEGIDLLATPLVLEHVKKIVTGFPDDEDEPTSVSLKSWSTDQAAWTDQDRANWRALVASDDCARVLRDFTFQFLLVAFLPRDSEKQHLKITFAEGYQAKLPGVRERLGFKDMELFAETPGIGWSPSYHIRFLCPRELQIIDIDLIEIDEKPSALSEAATYRARRLPTRANVYATGALEKKQYFVRLRLIAPVLGMLRAAWLNSLLTASVLAVLAINHERILAATSHVQTDAGVALLLVVPSFTAIYLARPDEHEILSQALRYVRYMLCVDALLTFVAAGILFVRLSDLYSFRTWVFLAAVAVLISILLTTRMIVASLHLSNSSEDGDATDLRSVTLGELVS